MLDLSENLWHIVRRNDSRQAVPLPLQPVLGFLWGTDFGWRSDLSPANTPPVFEQVFLNLYSPAASARPCPSCEYKFFKFAGFHLSKALKLLIFRDMKRAWAFLCSVSRLSATGGSFYFPRGFCNLYKCSRREARKSSTRCIKIL